MSSKYCGTELYKHGTNDENIRKQMQISWDSVPTEPKLSGTFGSFMCQMVQQNTASSYTFLSKFGPWLWALIPAFIHTLAMSAVTAGIV